MLRFLSIMFWLISAEAVAQHDSRADRLASMQRIMPVGAACANLDWEPISYCRVYSQGATLEIWSGLYGLGVTLSFDATGEAGLALVSVVREYFRLAGIAVEKLGHCIRNATTLHIEVADKSLELHCQLIDVAGSLSLEIFPESER
jgi:hypothetical protein